jgi:hypothetical protein
LALAHYLRGMAAQHVKVGGSANTGLGEHTTGLGNR